jgi:hypothetical protein
MNQGMEKPLCGMDPYTLIEQLCNDLNQAHDELMKIQGEAHPESLDWPEWTPQANSIREAEKLIARKLAKTDAWTLFPDSQQKETNVANEKLKEVLPLDGV